MEAVLQAESGGQPATSENTNVAEDNGGLSSADVVQRFAKRMLEKSAPVKAEPKEDAPAEDAPEETNLAAEPEAQATKTQPETEGEALDDDAEVLSQFPAKAQEKINKRIAAINAEKKAAEEKAAQLEARTKELEAKLNAVPEATQAQSAVQPEVNSLTANINDEAGFKQLVEAAKEADTALRPIEVRFAVAAASLYESAEAEGRTVTPEELGNLTLSVNGKTVKYSDIEYQRKAITSVPSAIDARRGFLQQRQTLVAQARQKFPELFDKSKPEYQQAEFVRRQTPQILSIPNHELLIGYALRGLKAEAAEQEAAAKAKQAKPAEAKPPSLGDSGAAAPKPKTALGANATLKRELEEAKKAYESSGSMQDRIHLERLKQRLKAAS